VQALTGAARDWPELLVDLHTHDSTDVRLAAAIGIRRLHEKAEETKTLENPNEYAGLAAFLEDNDENIVVDAARGIHDVSTPSPIALRALAEMLTTTKLKRESLLRRSINANRLLGDTASAERLLAFAARSNSRSEMQKEALELAVLWHRDLPVDRVLGFARVAKTGSPEAMTQALDKYFAQLAKEPSSALIDLVVNTNYQNGIPAVIALSQPETKDTALRAQALEALVAMNAPGGEVSMTAAAQSSESKLRQVAHRYLAKQAPTSSDTLRFLTEAIQRKDLREAQQAYALLGDIKATDVLRHEAEQLASGKRRPEIELELIEAIQASNDSEALALVNDVQATLLKGGNRTLGRGIFQTSVVAQCIRCHEFKGKGGKIGPDLTKVAARLSPEKLLESLVAPQAEIAEGYGLVSLVLKDGSAHAGTLVEKSDREYAIKDPTGNTRVIPSDEVETITPAMSSMPPMGAVLTPRELRDLMAYMVTLR
jgi:putative heme-binding domain-containing protein